MIKCKHCGGGKYYKNGITRGHQRYKCGECKRNYTETPIRGMGIKIKLQALMLYASGLSMNRIGQLLNVSNVSVLRWIRAFGEKLLDNHKDDTEVEKVIVMEMDEFWHYLKKRKTSFGSSKLMIVSEINLSIGKLETVLIKP